MDILNNGIQDTLFMENKEKVNKTVWMAEHRVDQVDQFGANLVWNRQTFNTEMLPICKMEKYMWK